MDSRHPPPPFLPTHEFPPSYPPAPGKFSRYLEPNGPPRVSYEDEKRLQQDARSWVIRTTIPQDTGEWMLREQAAEEIRAFFPRWEESRYIEHLLADHVRVYIVPQLPPERRTQFLDYVERMDQCRISGVVGEKPPPKVGKVVMWEHKCGLRWFCPDEARVDGMRVAVRYTPAIEGFLEEKPTHRVQKGVFTDHNFPPGQLLAGIQFIFDRWDAFRHHFPMIKGALIIMECPAAADGSWNVHLNVMLMIDGPIDWREVQAVWGANVDLQDIPRGTVAEAMPEMIKYTAKMIPAEGDGPIGSIDKRTGRPRAPALIEYTAAQLLEFIDAHKACRRVRGYGVLYAIDGKRWDAHHPYKAEDQPQAKLFSDQRRAWLQGAGFSPEPGEVGYLLTEWKDIPSEVKPKLREAINRGDDKLDIGKVEWLGLVKWSGLGYDLEMYGENQVPTRLSKRVDLILGDKSTKIAPLDEYLSPPSRAGPNWATGPPDA